MQRYLDFSTPFDFDPNQTVCTVCILDQSGSMEIEDYPPNRLQAAIKAVEAMVREKVKSRPHDKMGIVGFSNSGTCICPLTKVEDGNVILRSLKHLQTIGGTNFVAGLETAKAMFEKEADFSTSNKGILQLFFGQPKAKAKRIGGFVPHVVFLSDGYDDGGNAIKVAEKLKQFGTIIDCIGIGSNPLNVNENRLKAMASVDSHGNPRYRFIGDTSSLVREFQSMATLQVL